MSRLPRMSGLFKIAMKFVVMNQLRKALSSFVGQDGKQIQQATEEELERIARYWRSATTEMK